MPTIAGTTAFQVPTEGEVDYNPQAVAWVFGSEGEIDYNPEHIYFEFGNAGDAFYTSLADEFFEFGNAGEIDYAPQTNNEFAFREVFNVLPYTQTLDMSAYTRQTGEPNASRTKTAWYEYAPPNTFPSRLKFTITGASLAVFRRTTVDDDTDEDIDPTFAELTQVLNIASGTGFLDTDDSYESYYLQVGTAGAGTAVTLLAESADPPEGGTWDSALDIGGVWGSIQFDMTNAVLEVGEPVPAGITPTASTWLTWTPSTADEVKFTLLATGQAGNTGLTFYTGAAINALTQVASVVGAATANRELTITPTPGVTYHIQVTTTFDHFIHGLRWGGVPQLVSPEPVPTHLMVKVYQRDGSTLISELVNRSGCAFTESLNESSTGNIAVPLRDDIFKAYPNILNDGNIVKFWLGAKCVSGFRIQARQIQWVSSGEASDIVLSVAGPTLNFLLNDFVCQHDELATSASTTSRYFSWASRPDPGWYVAAKWNHKIMTSTQKNPPGDWKKSAKKRSRYGKPKKWPDKKSRWFWITNNKSRNGGWKPPFGIVNRYYRTNFNITKAGTKCQLLITGDNQVRVYVDGDLVLARGNKDNSYQSFSKTNIVFPKGVHTIAVHQIATNNGKSDDNVDGFMFSMYQLGKGGKRKKVLLRTNNGRGWVAYYGPNPPAWNRAQVLSNQIREARQRGNDAANAIKIDQFDTVTARDNVKWFDVWSQEVQIGASGYELMQQFSEGNYFDVAIDPDTLRLWGWTHRGIDKSNNIALVPGSNLLDFQTSESDNVANDIYVHYDYGFTRVQAPGSINKYGRREAYLEVGGVKTQADANKLVTRVLNGIDSAVAAAGSPDWRSKTIFDRDTGGVIGIHGAYPFLDYDIGDIISAPSGTDGVGSYKPYRVLSLTCTEDENGNLTFDPTLEEV